MAESMEALEKQNEEFNTRLTAAEAQSSQKEREREERHEKEMRDRVHQGKWPVDLEQQDNESRITKVRSKGIAAHSKMKSTTISLSM
jgi:hypothetical protein